MPGLTRHSDNMERADLRISKTRRGIFYAATMLYWFSIYTYVPILTPYVEKLGGSLFFAGLVVGAYGFSQLLVRIPIGIWSDRFHNRKAFMLAGIACGVISNLGFALTDSVPLTLLWRAIAGIAAGSWVAFTVMYAGYYPPKEAPRAMGIISFYTSVAQMAASALGGVVAQSFGWHAPFYLGAIGGLAALSMAAFVFEPLTVQGTPPSLRGLLAVGRQWPLLSVSLLAILAQSVTFTTLFGFTPLYASHLGATRAQLGLLTLLSTIPNALAGYLSGSWLVTRTSSRFTVVLGFVIAAIATALIPFTHTLSSLLVSQAINGFGQGLSMPVLMGLAIAGVANERRATAMGFFQAIYSVGMVAGPLLVGLAGSTIGLHAGFLGVAGTSLLAAILAFWWIKEPKGSSAQKRRHTARKQLHPNATISPFWRR